MKLRKNDQVVVLIGRDKGRSGKILQVLPAKGAVVVEGINIAKKHTKPSAKLPRGGIIEITKPIAASKLMVLDPKTGKPARIGYELTKGGKERVFKPTKRQAPAKPKAASKKADEKKADDKPAKNSKKTEDKA